MQQKQIILIGGAPTTGKSTLAWSLSQTLGLPFFPTDKIRSIMRTVADKNRYPALFNASGYDAERFLTELTTEQIVQMEFDQGEETWLGVKALIDGYCYYDTEKGCIIEGVGILPKMVAQDFHDNPHVTAFFLVDHDIARMRKAIFTRGLWDNAHKYGDHLKEKEVAWASLYSQKLEQEAQKYGYHWLEVHKNAKDLERVLTLL